MLQVAKSGYYAWLEREPCKRDVINKVLCERIVEIHARSDATYGVPRVVAELRDEGTVVNKKRVERLMRNAQIKGVSRRRGFVVTTNRDIAAKAASDLVKRNFTATRPNELWVADMTYIPTWAGFVYLAVVIDVFSRKVVGWQFGDRMTADLVLSTLNMALELRKPEDVIHHSDQGSQYTSTAFGKRCAQMGVRPSMGTVGDAYDNAMAESFFASLECELINRRTWQTKNEARMAVFTWIEAWYNPRRRHSGIGQMSPVNFERNYAASKLQTNESEQNGLPTACFAAVDNVKPTQAKLGSHCPQPSAVDNPVRLAVQVV